MVLHGVERRLTTAPMQVMTVDHEPVPLVGQVIRQCAEVLCRDGLPPPAQEVPMYDGPRIRAYLDGYWEAIRLALEVDDWETHGLRTAQERDRKRDRWL